MSNFKPRNLFLVLALVLALVLLAVIAWRYRPEAHLQTLVKALPEGVDVSLQDIDYTHVEAGRANWRLVAQQIERQAGTAILTISNPQVTFFAVNGEVDGTLQAAHGEVSEDYQRVVLDKDVVLQNASGYTLYTDHLVYDAGSQAATTDDPVRLQSERVTLTGRGLEYHLDTKKFRLNADVKGVLKPAPRK